jgi:hypothetical protein
MCGLVQFHKYSNLIARVVESGLKGPTIKGAGFDNLGSRLIVD